jgi:hypothetical protein
MLEDVAHLLAEGRAAGLAQAEHDLTGSAETVSQTGHLGGFPRPLSSFERDEFTGYGHAPRRCPPTRSKRAEKNPANKKDPGIGRVFLKGDS